MMSFPSIIVIAFGIAVLPGFTTVGGVIEVLDVPVAVRNGSGPIELTCVYNISETNDYGLVVKWYHENEQIYQWIPPMKPQDRGIIAGFTSYTSDTLNRPRSHSIINVTEATMDMSGKYSCIVATFSNEDVSETKKMIVYVPEESLEIRAIDFNETHVNLSCTAIGARPQPDLTIMTDFSIIKNLAISVDENYADYPRISLSGVSPKPAEPVIVECVIQIPGTGYGRRERLVYYPDGDRRSPAIEYMNDDNQQSSLPVPDTLSTTPSPSNEKIPTTPHSELIPRYSEPNSCTHKDGGTIFYNNVPPRDCY